MPPIVARSKSGGCCCGVTGPCTLCVHTQDCSSAIVSGATITVSQGGTTVGTCTTNSSGNCCVSIPSTGTYHVDAVKSGLATASVNGISVVCPGTTNITVVLADTNSSAFFSATLCGGNVPVGVNAILHINGGSYPLPPPSNIPLTLPVGTHSFTVTGYRINTFSDSITITNPCAGPIKDCALTVADGFACSPCGDKIPLLTTLQFTDSVYGSGTLTWNGLGWTGEITGVSFPGGCPACPSASNVKIVYDFPELGHCGAVITYSSTQFNSCPGNVNLNTMWSVGLGPSAGTWTDPPSFGSIAQYGICAGANTDADALYPSGMTLTVTE